MKYFSKFLPVEGEIKEGDKWTNSFHGGAMFFTEKEDVDPDYSFNPNKIGGQKVKLFLCSRDIQVGDNVKCLHNRTEGIVTSIKNQYNKKTGDYIPENIIHYGTRYFTVKSQLYKVIGEISSDALSYVKEGDEFDENQVEEWWAAKSNGRPMMKKLDEQGDRRMLEMQIPICYRIKGPCGHFH